MNTSGISFSGLISGLDSKSIIEQLVAISRRPITLIENQKDEVEAKISAWQEVNTRLSTLKSAVSALNNEEAFLQYSATLSNDELFSVSVSSEASAGTYTVEVNQLARAEQLSSNSFDDIFSELGLSGEILINGTQIVISADDSLDDIRDAINDADANVSATIINVSENDHRLVLTSKELGSDGIRLSEVSGGVLQSLGFQDDSVSIRNPIENGARTDFFTSKTASIADLLDLESTVAGNVTIGDQTIEIDLSSDSLEDIVEKIESAAPSGVTVSIEEEISSDDSRTYRLNIMGTTSFSDDNNVLQVLGILEGGHSEINQSLTADVTNTINGTEAVTEDTTFAEIFNAGVTDGDTITISGTDHDGNAISTTYTVNTANTLRDFLDAIETAFGGGIAASIDSDGRLVVTDSTSGDSKLSVVLIENNEGGGNLSFGTLEVSTVGRKRMLQQGQNAELKVNGIAIERTTNTIDDVINGVTLNLEDADPDTVVTLEVAQDTNAIVGLFQTFVESYNDLIEYINEQFDYDIETQQGGTLLGDSSLMSMHSQIRSILINEVTGIAGDFTTLASIGISSDSDGLLSIDSGELVSALQNKADDVIELLSAQGSSPSSKITYIGHSNDTNPGTYNIEITQAAERAQVVASTAVSDSGLAQDENLTITELTTGISETITLSAGDDIDTIVSRINDVLGEATTQTLTSDTANTTDGTSPVSSDTTFSEIYGANVSDGETIEITGTDRDGKEISETFTISDVTDDTIGDLLTTIENAFSGEVTAIIDSSGRIVITDNSSGSSELSLELTYAGEGDLTLGTFETTVQGRYEIPITASSEDGKLTLTHDNYGSSSGISVVSDVEDAEDGGSTGIGIETKTDYGEDVAGTINGESATGKGQYLTGDSGNENTDGLSLLIEITPDEIETAGGAYESTVTLTFGIAEQLENLLDRFTDSVDGLITLRQENLEDEIDELDQRISNIEDRVAMEQERLERTFVELERAISEMQSQSSYFLAQIASLSNSKQNSSSLSLT